MNIRTVTESLAIDCTNPANEAAFTVLRYYLHRYLCSIAEYIYGGEDVRFTTDNGAEIEINANHEMPMMRLKLTLEDQSMEITQPDEILKLIAFSGLMHIAGHISYEASFSYNDRRLIFRAMQMDAPGGDFVPAEDFFGNVLKNEEFTSCLTFRSVVVEEDPSVRSVVSLGKDDTTPRFDDAAFSQEVRITQNISAWYGSWIVVGIHFPETTESTLTERILGGLRDLCRVYGDVDADDHIDTYEGEYDIGFATALSFDAAQQEDVFARLTSLVEMTKAAGGTATFEGDIEAKENPYLICRLQTADDGSLSITYATL